MARGWLDLFGSLGEALVEVLGAEAAALQNNLGKTGRRYAVVVALFAFAVFAFFWAIGVAAFALYMVIALQVDPWIAAVIVCALWVLLGVIVWSVAQSRLRAIESPSETVRRHVEEHREWMQSNLFGHSTDGVAGSPSLGPGNDVDSS